MQATRSRLSLTCVRMARAVARWTPPLNVRRDAACPCTRDQTLGSWPCAHPGGGGGDGGDGNGQRWTAVDGSRWLSVAVGGGGRAGAATGCGCLKRCSSSLPHSHMHEELHGYVAWNPSDEMGNRSGGEPSRELTRRGSSLLPVLTRRGSAQMAEGALSRQDSETLESPITLSLHIGLGCGAITLVHLGGHQSRYPPSKPRMPRRSEPPASPEPGPWILAPWTM